VCEFCLGFSFAIKHDYDFLNLFGGTAPLLFGVIHCSLRFVYASTWQIERGLRYVREKWTCRIENTHFYSGFNCSQIHAE